MESQLPKDDKLLALGDDSNGLVGLGLVPHLTAIGPCDENSLKSDTGDLLRGKWQSVPLVRVRPETRRRVFY
jgi:hypothetical protein